MTKKHRTKHSTKKHSTKKHRTKHSTKSTALSTAPKKHRTKKAQHCTFFYELKRT